MERLHFLLLFFTLSLLHGQLSKREFEKKYLEFHDKWDAGYDADLAEIDSVFVDCPDLERYPHYFLYKGDWMRFSGYYDLALKYYLTAQKYIEMGYENKNIYDHRPIMYFKLGYTYYELNAPKEFKENIEKGKAFVDKAYELQNEVLFTELEGLYLFHYTEDKNKAMDLLETIYAKASKHPEASIFNVIGRIRLRVIRMALKVGDYQRTERLIKAVRKDPWFQTINGDYARWYYEVNRDYHLNKKEYAKAIVYNDSIYHTSPLELEDKELVFENHIELYASIGKKEVSEQYKDSLNGVLKVQRQMRIESSVLLTQENKKYENLITNISSKNKRQKRLWSFSFVALGLLLMTIIVWYGKRRRIIKSQLVREQQKVELLNDNYQQLLKNYQFTTKQLEKIKNTLAVEIQKRKSPEIISLHRSISTNISSNFNEKLLSINKLRDQFILNLKERFSDLTNYESLICFYTKMGLSAKEISQITNLTLRSIQSHQYRIGQKTKKQFNSKLKDFLEKVPLSVF